MEKNIELSIIIVSFNSGRFLPEALNSIFQGSLFSKLFEVIIVDNCSEDNSVKQISDFILSHPKNNILFFKKNTNEGFAKANNFGIKKSQGKYILLLNPDTKLNNDTLETMLNFMKDNPLSGIATCKVILSDGKIDDACHRGFPTAWNAFCQFSGLANFFPNSDFFNGYHLGYKNLDEVHEIDSATGAFMLVRKEVGNEVNWFDEDYFWYGEDIDFCYRVKQKGWKIMFVPTVKISHLKGASSGIKDHSQKISTASKETKVKATEARFEVMKIFYKKHYRDKYPKWLTDFIMMVIDIKKNINLFKYKRNHI